MGISRKLIKPVIIYMALIMVFFTFATIKINAEEAISYGALCEDNLDTLGCKSKFPARL